MPVPEAVVVKLKLLPIQTGLLLEIIGVSGIGTTVTFVVAGILEQPFRVTDREYVPALTAVALLITGFWSVDVKPLGPDQL